jgi:hypothetical protein
VDGPPVTPAGGSAPTATPAPDPKKKKGQK